MPVRRKERRRRPAASWGINKGPPVVDTSELTAAVEKLQQDFTYVTARVIALAEIVAVIGNRLTELQTNGEASLSPQQPHRTRHLQ